MSSRLLAAFVALFLITIAVNYTFFPSKTNSDEVLLNSGSLLGSQKLMERMTTFVGETVRSSDARLPKKPVRRYAFIKTHKTGSTTVWYVMRLYAYNHGLRTVEPRVKVNLGYPRHLELNNSRMYRQTHSVGEYEALFDHCRFNKSVLDELLNKPVYVTILREPITRFVSAFYFLDEYRSIAKGKSVGQFVSNIDKYKDEISRSIDQFGRFNGMAFDLGVDPPYKDEDVKNKIIEMEESFRVVLIMEYMPESMVLLKRTMGWELDDVIAIPQNSHPDLAASKSATEKYTAHHTGESLDVKQKETIAKLGHADMKIYHHFNVTFWKRVQAESKFEEEVQLYQEKLELYLKERERRGLLENDIALGRIKPPAKELPAYKHQD